MNSQIECQIGLESMRMTLAVMMNSRQTLGMPRNAEIIVTLHLVSEVQCKETRP